MLFTNICREWLFEMDQRGGFPLFITMIQYRKPWTLNLMNPCAGNWKRKMWVNSGCDWVVRKGTATLPHLSSPTSPVAGTRALRFRASRMLHGLFTWEIHGNYMAIPWESHGKSVFLQPKFCPATGPESALHFLDFQAHFLGDGGEVPKKLWSQTTVGGIMVHLWIKIVYL